MQWFTRIGKCFMKLDEVVKRRFDELALKANEVSESRHGDYNNYVGHELFYEWGTSVMSLLQRAFGDNSIHYRNFVERYQDFDYRFTTLCVLIGVSLEITLKELCLRSNLPIGKLDRMNVDLRKANTYNLVK